MAIVKAVNTARGSIKALNNAVNYVLQDKKTEPGLAFVSGYWENENITAYDVVRTFLEDKESRGKLSGRMYMHTVISFHKDEKILKQEVLDFGRQWSEKIYPSHQHLIVVHKDKGHTHCHIIVNSVSYVDGKKYRISSFEFAKSKELCNEMCLERGLSVAVKGRHFDGSPMEAGEITTWSQKEYRAINNGNKRSVLRECGVSILNAFDEVENIKDFVTNLEKYGWRLSYNDRYRYVMFKDDKGHYVSGKKMQKLFGVPGTHKEILNEIERRRKERDELASLYKQLEGFGRAAGKDYGRPGQKDQSTGDVAFGKGERYPRNLIRELADAERASEEIRNNCELERKNREIEQIRFRFEECQRDVGRGFIRKTEPERDEEQDLER